MSIAEIKKMSTIERIQTMEILWDMLSSEQENIKSPEWHGRILKERQRKIAKGKMKFISLDQLKDHFRKWIQEKSLFPKMPSLISMLASCFMTIVKQVFGQYFIDSLITDLESLRFYSGIHVKCFDCHRMLSKRFPFAIYYSIAGERVSVIAVLDMRRNPTWLVKQIRKRTSRYRWFSVTCPSV